MREVSQAQKGTSPQLEAEIQELEQKLAEKKRLLEQSGETPERIDKRTIFSAVLKEHIEQKVKEHHSTSPQPPAKPPETTEKEIIEQKIKPLIEIALTQGVEKAMKSVKEMTPYEIDAFHDQIVNHYYEMLLARGKLKQI